MKPSNDEKIDDLSCPEQHCAKILYDLHGHHLKFVGKHIWYEFKGHRWYRDYEVLFLSKIEELTKIYEEKTTKIKGHKWNMVGNQLNKDLKEKISHNIQLLEKYTGIGELLRTYSFKKKIMQAAQLLFHEPDFEEKLDVDPDLICFNNGVYDLKKLQLRDGLPSDYLSHQAGCDYQKVDLDESMNQLMSQLFPSDELSSYVTGLLASTLRSQSYEPTVINSEELDSARREALKRKIAYFDANNLSYLNFHEASTYPF